MSKKFLIYSLAVFTFFSIAFLGCGNKQDLAEYVSQLKCNVYCGESDKYSLKATYGFIESPTNNDGVINSRIFTLTFKLFDKEDDNVSYFIELDKHGTVEKQLFKLNPVTNSLNATFNFENFDKNEFSVTLIAGTDRQEITMKSIIPKDTLSYSEALDMLWKNQPDLIEKYRDSNGVFNAEIHLRIIIKNEKPYWYVGLVDKYGNLKAFLLDGFNGTVLAIRNVI